jgi:hypothetical protein
MSYDKNMTGIISKNDRKTDEKHPDIKGQCEINGVQYWVDGWQKTRTSDGGKFYSLKFKPKDAAQKPAAPKSAPAPSGFCEFDDAPF